MKTTYAALQLERDDLAEQLERAERAILTAREWIARAAPSVAVQKTHDALYSVAVKEIR